MARDGRTTTHVLLLASQSPLMHGLLLNIGGQEANCHLILPDFFKRDLENLVTLLMEGEILVRNVSRFLCMPLLGVATPGHSHDMLSC